MTTAIPQVIQNCLDDPLLCDALANVLDTLIRLRTQEAACAQLAISAAACDVPEEENAPLRQAASLARTRRALGDTAVITEEKFSRPFFGERRPGPPGGDWEDALGDTYLTTACCVAAKQLLALQELQRHAGSNGATKAVEALNWVLHLLAEEPF
jgi:hypothetical protein